MLYRITDFIGKLAMWFYKLLLMYMYNKSISVTVALFMNVIMSIMLYNSSQCFKKV